MNGTVDDQWIELEITEALVDRVKISRQFAKCLIYGEAKPKIEDILESSLSSLTFCSIILRG
jgi:hypothetical protein